MHSSERSTLQGCSLLTGDTESPAGRASLHCPRCGDTRLAPFCLSWRQSQAVRSLNGSLLVHTCTASLAAQVSSGDTFAQADVHTASGCCAHLDGRLQHAWPRLQALGSAPSNHIRVSVEGDQPRRAQREVALGQCTLISHGDVRTEANATQTTWTLSLVTHCSLLDIRPSPPISAGYFPPAQINCRLYAQFCVHREGLPSFLTLSLEFGAH